MCINMTYFLAQGLFYFIACIVIPICLCKMPERIMLMQIKKIYFYRPTKINGSEGIMTLGKCDKPIATSALSESQFKLSLA